MKDTFREPYTPDFPQREVLETEFTEVNLFVILQHSFCLITKTN